MRGNVKLGKIIGIPIFLHSSWFLIFGLITYSLGLQFGSSYPQWTRNEVWGLALATSALFFGSVVFHELSHSVVAQHYHIPVASITLFFFGGVASITREPETAGQEFQIAFAGPLSSYALAGAFRLVSLVAPQGTMLNALGTWLFYVNLMLATFNLLLPGFPLDGGRIFRSIVWGITKDYTRATRIAARGGQAVAYGMMAFGISVFIWPSRLGFDMLDGLWFVLIGWFLLTVARQSYAQVAARGALEGLHASDIMTVEMPSVPRDASLEEYAHQASHTGRRSHLVVADGQLVGFINIDALQRLPRDEWPCMSVQAVMVPRDRVQWATPEDPAIQLLDRMRNPEVDQVPVISRGTIVGMVTRDSILRVVRMRNDLRHLVTPSSSPS